jgi:nucleoside-diphosphate-sugar epimerase
VIYGSSISVYGSRDTASETDVPAPEDMYGATKRYVEMLGDAYRGKHGIRFVALRISSVVGPGATNTSSRWRSELFEKLSAPGRAEVRLPYKADQALPLVHVEDVAEMIARLTESDHLEEPVYNTPSETWRLDDLAECVASLDTGLRLTFGRQAVKGIPAVIDGLRFSTEFGYRTPSVRDRLRDAAGAQRTPGEERD